MNSKEKLKKMLDAMIDGNDEQSEVNFHSFLNDKMKVMIHGEEAPEEEVVVTPEPEKTEEK